MNCSHLFQHTAPLLAALFLQAATMQAQEEYGILIYGAGATTPTVVTSDNRRDVFGDGQVNYDPTTKRLQMEGEFSGMSNTGVDGLILELTGDVTFYNRSRKTPALISTQYDMTIDGSADYALDLMGSAYKETQGILIDNSERAITFTIADGISVSSDQPIVCKTTEKNPSKLVVKDASVIAIECTDYEKQAIAGFMGGIELNSILELAYPEGGEIKKGGVVDGEGNPAFLALILPMQTLDLWICGVQVSILNLEDVLGDGMFRYDPETNTLRVAEGDIDTEDGNIIWNIGLDGLTIDVAGETTMHYIGTPIVVNCNTTITGGGHLTVLSDQAKGISVNEGAKLIISNIALDVTADEAIAIDGDKATGNECLEIYEADITASGGLGAISNFDGGITLEACRLREPAEGSASEAGTIVDAEGTTANAVTIGTAIDTGLDVCGVAVTDFNCEDVLGNGIFCYDPETNTLKVNGNANSELSIIKNRSLGGLTIDFTKPTKLKSDESVVSAWRSTTITTSFEGKGEVLLESAGEGAIFVSGGATLTIDHATLTANGLYGISGSRLHTEKLVVQQSAVNANGNDGAVSDFESITLVNSLIMDPEGAKILNGSIVDENDQLVPAVTIGVNPSAISSLQHSTPTTAPRYNVAGQRVDNSYHGIVIEGGKKKLVK